MPKKVNEVGLMMNRGPFEPNFEDLPKQIPLFPLSGALLLPGGRLPLNIFEPRYLAMVKDAMATPERLIGMIQTQSHSQNDELFSVGCAGRIVDFSESDDGRLLITLAGTARFRYLQDKLVQDGYRLGQVDFSDFKEDLIPDTDTIDRAKLIDVLKSYFEIKGFTADWAHIDDCEDERLITTLAMICPFAVSEKQALLETANLVARTELLIAILEMSTHNNQDSPKAQH